jgi:glycyl-tRNA synthetase beta chain
MNTLPLLLEIGVEEIPARFVAAAQQQFGSLLQSALQSARLLPEANPLAYSHAAALPSPGDAVVTYSTPRRLIAYAPHVLRRQPDQVEQVMGPSAKVAFDAEDRPTRAAESFAAKNGVGVHELVRVETTRGQYVMVRKTTTGQKSNVILEELLAGLIARISFPRNMYWLAKSGPTFVRPVRWLLALLGEGAEADALRFSYGDIAAAAHTFGHRLRGNSPLGVESFADYAQKLRQHLVEFDPENRRQAITTDSNLLLDDLGLRLLKDNDLLEWIVNSTEWPTPLLGAFDARFLHLPREVLITVMRDHQKYFAVEDAQGRLQPRFLVVLNRDEDKLGVIRRGHERVLTARFSDAEFFWDADQRQPLGARAATLQRVTYHEKLGSYADKVKRMSAVGEKISALLEEQGRLKAGDGQLVLRAIQLCKCDLTTQMVQEFTELQGIVGGLYAKVQGEPGAVADAIYDHYRPEGIDDRLPRSLIGAVASLADKLDSLAGGFIAGNAPTGSKDPFGLRRAGNGIIKILVEYNIAISMNYMVSLAVLQYCADARLGDQPDAAALGRQVAAFLLERLAFYLEQARGLRFDTVRAALGGVWEMANDLARRAEALERIRDTEDFVSLATAAKRTQNILAKSAAAEDLGSGAVNETLLEDGPERELYAAYRAQRDDASAEAGSGRETDYGEVFRRLASLRPAVDNFFDHVLVMAPDAEVRRNRLSLLALLDGQVFSRLARLSEMAPAHVDAPTKGAVAPQPRPLKPR